METVTPSADRISAALRALRQMHAQDSEDKASLAIKCLNAVIAELAVEGVPAEEDLQPLAELEELVRDAKTKPLETKRELAQRCTQPDPARPRGRSDRSLGQEWAGRERGGPDRDAPPGRRWRASTNTRRRRLRLAAPLGVAQQLEWRNSVHQGFGPEDAKYEYRTFAREIEAIPPAEWVSRVLDERLWDRRRKPR